MEELALPAVLEIGSVQDLKEKFNQALQSDRNEIRINASQVVRADTASMQLIASFVKTAYASDKEIHWSEVSEILSNNFRLLGLENFIFEKQ